MGIGDPHPADCPEFEYANHPGRRTILPARVADLLIRLRRRDLDGREVASDTRSGHRFLFESMTPDGHDYYAGHYRGEPFRCLEHYRVGIQGDARVGYPPHLVPGHMDEFANLVRAAIEALDSGHNVPGTTPGEKLYFTVAVACRIFELLNRIHPYANGNGHAARLCIWAILGRYGYWPERWPIEPRPPDPPYTTLLVAYRNGNREPLEGYVLNCIAG